MDPRPYWFLYNLQGDGQRGTLTWTHTQEGDQPSRYSITFDTVAPGQSPGPAPRGWIGDGDALLDLIVGVGDYVVLYRNIGTKTAPRFRRDPVLQVDWVPGRAHPDWIGDWDGTGGLDMLSAAGGTLAELRRCRRCANPPLFGSGTRLTTASGKDMAQPPKHGDPWAAAIATDFDADGDLDVLVGGVAGFVWLCENTGTRDKLVFAEGRRLELADGKPLVAGMDPDTAVTDFTVLQGNRAVPACADFSGDGLTDLVVGDATGGLTYFANVGEKGKPKFAAGVSLGKLAGRVHVAAGDMNGDDIPDLVIAQSGAGEGQQVIVAETTRRDGKAQFGLPGRKLPLCWIPYPPPSIVDLSGDGEPDIVLASSYATLYWAEHSFVRGESGGGGEEAVGGCEPREGTDPRRRESEDGKSPEESAERRIAKAQRRGTVVLDLCAADIVILLVSDDFIASEYCQDVKMEAARARAAAGEARVVPDIPRACRWQRSRFAKCQVLPRDGKPVAEWQSRDAAWQDVAEGLWLLAEELI